MRWTDKMVNFSSLNNITTFSFNTSLINDSKEIIPNMAANANTVTDGYFGLGFMVVVYLILIYIIFRDDGDIRMDIARTIFFSSGITSILGLLLLIPGLVSSFQHVAWFIIMFTFSAIGIYYLRKKGQ